MLGVDVLMPHLARSAPLSFFRLKIADDPKETGDRVRVPKVARVLVARRFALVPQAAKVVDHALESLDVGNSRTISSTGRVDPLALASNSLCASVLDVKTSS